MSRKYLFALLLCVLGLGSAHADKVFQWVDENGVTHFSDRPQPGAYELNVDVTPPVSEGPIVEPRAPLGKEAKPINYRVSITSPSNEQTIRNNEGIITVRAAADPRPLNSMGYKLLLDGVPQGSIQNSGSFTLTNIDRGAHTIEVQLVERSGKEIASSKPITVFLHRASAISFGAAAGGG